MQPEAGRETRDDVTPITSITRTGCVCVCVVPESLDGNVGRIAGEKWAKVDAN